MLGIQALLTPQSRGALGVNKASGAGLVRGAAHSQTDRRSDGLTADRPETSSSSFFGALLLEKVALGSKAWWHDRLWRAGQQQEGDCWADWMLVD